MLFLEILAAIHSNTTSGTLEEFFGFQSEGSIWFEWAIYVHILFIIFCKSKKRTVSV